MIEFCPTKINQSIQAIKLAKKKKDRNKTRQRKNICDSTKSH